MLTVYKASAGSGKTFTLTLEYIRTLLGLRQPDGTLLLNSDKYAPGGHRHTNRHRHILAITFTVAATGEMKSRIIDDLNILANADTVTKSKYFDLLSADFGCSAAELSGAAKLALTELLFDYRCFYVSTIDSFFQTVLRTFSREIDHQGDYELFLDTLEVLGRSTSLMLDSLNHDGDTASQRLYHWIRSHTYDALSKGNAHNIFNRSGKLLGGLVRTVDNAMDETFGIYYDRLFEYFSNPAKIKTFADELTRRIDQCLEPMRRIARQALDMLDSRDVPADARPSLCSRLATLAAGRVPADKDLAINPLTNPDKVTAKDIFYRSKCPLSDADKELFVSIVAPLCFDLVDTLKRRRYYSALLDSLGELEFVFIARRHLEQYLREGNALLISDSGELLKRIISDAEMPFIYERTGMHLQTLLIDEFQDTSHVQWHNLKPLVSHSLANGHQSLIIGDEKQAIYGFRNSDSEILGSQVETVDFPGRTVPRGHLPQDNTNRRSAPEVVRFNNTLFSRLARRFDAAHFANVVQSIDDRHSKLSAYIRLTFHRDGTPEPDTVIEQMCTDILAQHKAGYRWADILILCRRRKEAAAVVDHIIRFHPEIAVLSSEALLLNSSPAVRSIVSMLKLVSRSYRGERPTRGDDAPQYANRADVAMMITRFNHFMSQAVDAETALEMALAESADAGERISSQVMKIKAENPANLVALVEAIIAHKLTAEQRRNEYAYIAAFQDRVLKHCESPDPSIAAFLRDYDRNIAKWAILAPADLDAVEVMTIHKSKGLERDCVHIPFGDWEMKHPTIGLWVATDGLDLGFDSEVPPLLRLSVSAKSPLRDADISPFAHLIRKKENQEILDNLNNTYVAYTRAKRELIAHLDCSADGVGQKILDAINDAGDDSTAGDSRLIALADYYDDLTGTLTIGEPTKGDARESIDSAGAVDAGSYYVNLRRDVRAIVSIDDILSTDINTGDEADKEIVDAVPAFGGTPDMIRAGRVGIILHAVLASMRTVDDLDRALDRQCARAGVVDAERLDFRRQLIDAFAAGGTTVAQWFDPANRIYAERSIYVPGRGETVRPDRVIVRPDGRTVIIDYKFTTEAKPSHRRQVAEYVGLMRSLGAAEVDAFLWYPFLGKIIKI